MAADHRGGRREGAGRKPGPATLAARAAASEERLSPYQLPPGDPRIGLTPPQRACITLRARGGKYTEIARKLSIDADTAKAWCEKHGEAIEAELAELKGPNEFVRPLLPFAYEAMYDCLAGDDDPSVRLAAAKDVMDRYFGKPKVLEGAAPGVSVNITFVSAQAPTVIDGEAREVPQAEGA